MADPTASDPRHSDPMPEAEVVDVDVAEAVASAPEEVTAAPAPVRPRRRGLIAAIVVVGIVVVLGVAAVIAENVARAQAQALIAEQVRQALQLEADHPVDVAIEGGPVLLQAAGGELERVVIELPGLPVGELRGDLSLVVEGTPLDPTQPTDAVQAVFEVAEADVAAIVGALSGAVATDVRLDEREIRFEAGFDLFGVPFTIGLGLTPTVEDGQVLLTPSSVVLGDERLPVDDLQEQFGGIVDPLLAGQRFCVAQYLPRALELTAVQVGDEQLVVVLQAADVALDGPEFSTLGTCG